MAGEALQTAAQLLAGYPDNTQGLIAPLNTRQHVISASNDVAFVRETFSPPVVVNPTLDPTDTNLCANWTVAAGQAFRFWDIDGNGRLFPDYGTITVPGGTLRILSIQFLAVFTRLPTGSPATFGGNYGYDWSDVAPVAGDIAANSNLTQHRINYTDDDGNNLTTQWQSLRVDDVVNINGVLYKITAIVQNAADLEITHDLLSRQAETGGADTIFSQGLSADSHNYQLNYFEDGVATGAGLVYAIGPDPVVVGLPVPKLVDYSTQPLFDVRIAKTDLADPGVELHTLIAQLEGTLI